MASRDLPLLHQPDLTECGTLLQCQQLPSNSKGKKKKPHRYKYLKTWQCNVSNIAGDHLATSAAIAQRTTQGRWCRSQRGQYPHSRQKQMADVWRGCCNKGLLLQHKSCSWRHVCDNNISPSGLRCYLWHSAKRFHYKPAAASELILVLNQKASWEEEHMEQRCFQRCTKSSQNS